MVGVISGSCPLTGFGVGPAGYATRKIVTIRIIRNSLIPSGRNAQLLVDKAGGTSYHQDLKLLKNRRSPRGMKKRNFASI